MNKQIEEKRELVDILYWSGYGFDRGTCNDLARQIYEQGYRRQDEVAREIFTEIENSISPMLGLEDDKEYVAILATTFAELKKKYGVKEDESES